MLQVTCPRCRTVIEVVDGLARCPACGVRKHFGIYAAPPTRQRSTAIAAGMPRSAAADEPIKPATYLERLLRRLRRWRYAGEPMSEEEMEIRQARIGWLMLIISMLPYITCAPLLVLFPAVAYVTVAQGPPMFGDWRDHIIPVTLGAVPMAALGAFIWYRIHRRGA
jgi:hypothetical protein